MKQDELEAKRLLRNRRLERIANFIEQVAHNIANKIRDLRR